jgi:hypothetical protein
MGQWKEGVKIREIRGNSKRAILEECLISSGEQLSFRSMVLLQETEKSRFLSETGGAYHCQRTRRIAFSTFEMLSQSSKTLV